MLITECAVIPAPPVISSQQRTSHDNACVANAWLLQVAFKFFTLRALESAKCILQISKGYYYDIWTCYHAPIPSVSAFTALGAIVGGYLAMWEFTICEQKWRGNNM